MATTRSLFKENLKYWRQKAGLTQEALSEKIGYGVGYISELESRKIFPKPETIDEIAAALNIKPSQLFEEQGCPVNVAMFNRAEFIDELLSELHPLIKADLEKCLDEKL